MKKQIPNTVSALRIIGAAALAFLPVFTMPFFVVYGVCVLFDFADGFLAKRLDAKTQLGCRLDHIASILFIVILTVRYISVTEVPMWAVYTVTGIALIKCASLVFGAVRFRKPPFINTDWNKWAKCAFYLAPFWYLFAGMTFTCAVVLFTMLVASAEEFLINIKSKSFDPEVKTIIDIKKYLKKFKNKRK